MILTYIQLNADLSMTPLTVQHTCNCPELTICSHIIPLEVKLDGIKCSNWLLLLDNEYIRSLVSFHGLTAHFLLALTQIPLSWNVTVYTLTYRSTFQLFPSFEQSYHKHPHIGFV